MFNELCFLWAKDIISWHMPNDEYIIRLTRRLLFFPGVEIIDPDEWSVNVREDSVVEIVCKSTDGSAMSWRFSGMAVVEDAMTTITTVRTSRGQTPYHSMYNTLPGQILGKTLLYLHYPSPSQMCPVGLQSGNLAICSILLMPFSWR